MAVVKMRDLMRRPKPVFAELEKTGEPVLVTRNGEAIAALFPVNPQEAAETALAALPEFAESRRRAEHARGEGRTRSAADVARDLAARQEEPQASSVIRSAEEGPPVEPSQPVEALVGAIAELFGGDLGHELAPQIAAEVAAASEPVIYAADTTGLSAPESGEGEEDPRQETRLRIHQLTSELFESLLPGTLKSKVADLLSAPTVGSTAEHKPVSEPSGVFGKQLAEETLEDVTSHVKMVNSVCAQRLAGNFSLPLYEAFIKGTEVIGMPGGIGAKDVDSDLRYGKYGR